MEKELWKDLRGYIGLYQVSNLGRVKSLYREATRMLPCGKVGVYKRKEKIMKLCNCGGYLLVNLSIGINNKLLGVHRLVAESFLQKTAGKEVNHIDGNKSNNLLINLEYVTRSENGKHAYKMGLSKSKRGELSHRAKLTKIQVLEIREKYLSGEYTHLKLANIFGISQPQVTRIINNQKWVDAT